MSVTWSKYEVMILSDADYAADGVGYSTAQDDYPAVIGADQPYDTIAVERPWGRDPATGHPLWISEAALQRYTSQVTQHGITSSWADVIPTYGQVPDATLIRAKITNAAILNSIDGDVKHFILGVNPLGVNIEEGNPVPPSLEPYRWDVAIPSARRTELRDFFVARGVAAQKVDNWLANNPNATPMDVRDKMEDFLRLQEL